MARMTLRWACVLGAAAALGACNTTPPKQAGGECPEGTVLHGKDCVPNDGPSSGGGGGGGSSTNVPETTTATHETPPPTSGVPYDKEAVDLVLARAARQVKANCGAATDENGKVTGPWGTTKISVKLSHNGNSRDVTVPSPYDGTPPGKCVIQAFQNMRYPPFAGSDVVVEKEVEIIEPKH